jgi:hypothetical protein
MKKRGAGGSLSLFKVQHFDSMISLARRVLMKFARFSGIGANGESQIADGTIGNVAGAFLMQLVASPASRPDKGHLWSFGCPAKYNADGTATPMLSDWGTKDDDIEPLTVDTDTAYPPGSVGVILRGTEDDNQKLLFVGPQTSPGGGGAWLFGDGFDGNVTIDTTDQSPMLSRFQYTTGGYGANTEYQNAGVAIVNNTWVQQANRQLFCVNCDVNAGVILQAAFTSVLFCTDTLTISGEITASGGTNQFLQDVLAGAKDNGSGATTAGVVGPGGGNNPNPNTPPFDEVRVNFSGNGGSDGIFSGGTGGGNGELPIRPGETVLGGDDVGTGNMARTQVDMAGDFSGATIPFTGGTSGASGAATIGTSGKGGKGGGILIIRAKKIVNGGAGKITADGGDGGSPTGGAAGGGGGGNPGVILIFCEDWDSSITISRSPGKGVSGGTDGLGAGYVRIVDKTGLVYP